MENKETLEEILKKEYNLETIDNDVDNIFLNWLIEGIKWQQKRSYSEEEVLKMLKQFNKDAPDYGFGSEDLIEWFNQNKKK